MTLSVSDYPVDGQFRISGIARNPDLTGSLGRRYFRVGAHYIGFDDDCTRPVTVRSYFDPAQLAAAGRLKHPEEFERLGYMQFMRLSFAGLAIPPEVYGGRLASRQAYVSKEGEPFLDFMDPVDARTMSIQLPFYPYNAMLNAEIHSESELFTQPAANGCLYSPHPAEECGRDCDQSTVASLAAEIGAGLITPAGVRGYLSEGNKLVTIPARPGEDGFRIALNYLRAVPLPGRANPPLAADLEDSSVVAEAVGDHLLLTLPGGGELGDTLVVTSQPREDGGEQVVIHLLSDYDMAGLTADATRNALWRIEDYRQRHQNQKHATGRLRVPHGRGSHAGSGSGAHGAAGGAGSTQAASEGEFALELQYWSAVVGVQRGKSPRADPRYRMIDCITWSALFEFDEDTGLMTLAAIREPKPTGTFDVVSPIARFGRALRADPRRIADTGYFTKAAMRRENFAEGTKLRFVNEAGQDI